MPGALLWGQIGTIALTCQELAPPHSLQISYKIETNASIDGNTWDFSEKSYGKVSIQLELSNPGNNGLRITPDQLSISDAEGYLVDKPKEAWVLDAKQPIAVITLGVLPAKKRKKSLDMSVKATMVRDPLGEAQQVCINTPLFTLNRTVIAPSVADASSLGELEEFGKDREAQERVFEEIMRRESVEEIKAYLEACRKDPYCVSKFKNRAEAVLRNLSKEWALKILRHGRKPTEENMYHVRLQGNFPFAQRDMPFELQGLPESVGLKWVPKGRAQYELILTEIPAGSISLVIRDRKKNKVSLSFMGTAETDLSMDVQVQSSLGADSIWQIKMYQGSAPFELQVREAAGKVWRKLGSTEQQAVLLTTSDLQQIFGTLSAKGYELRVTDAEGLTAEEGLGIQAGVEEKMPYKLLALALGIGLIMGMGVGWAMRGKKAHRA